MDEPANSVTQANFSQCLSPVNVSLCVLQIMGTMKNNIATSNCPVNGIYITDVALNHLNGKPRYPRSLSEISHQRPHVCTMVKNQFFNQSPTNTAGGSGD
jgi:hypothetical protein